MQPCTLDRVGLLPERAFVKADIPVEHSNDGKAALQTLANRRRNVRFCVLATDGLSGRYVEP